MRRPTFTRHERVVLKSHPDFNEKWLQDLISDDPSILGLGEVALLDRERRQEKAGRLDLLLADTGNDRRYEVELMLGSTDESHIIRCIEYWDIERRRYPAYEHVAVLIAEDVTGRFLNLLSLFAGSIPLIVIQCQALLVGEQLVLDFVRVLDQTSLRRDDESEAPTRSADRDFWLNRVGPEVLGIADRILAVVNEQSERDYSLNYNKHNIGLMDGSRGTRFVLFLPRKKFMILGMSSPDAAASLSRCEQASLDAEEPRAGRVRIRITSRELDDHQDLLKELVGEAVKEYEA